MWLFKHVLNKKVFVSLYERKMICSKHCRFTWDSCQTRDPVPSLSCNVSSHAVSDNVKLISSLFVVALHDTTRQQQIHTCSLLFGHCTYSRWEYPLIGNSERLWLNILYNKLCDVFSINHTVLVTTVSTVMHCILNRQEKTDEPDQPEYPIAFSISCS